MTRESEIEALAMVYCEGYAAAAMPASVLDQFFAEGVARAEAIIAARDRYRAARQPAPETPTPSEMEDLAADAVSALRYISTNYGEHDGVGWRRVFEKAAKLKPRLASVETPTPRIEVLAEEVASALFTDYNGLLVDRLVLTYDGPHREMGGLCYNAVRDTVAQILRQHAATLKERKEKADV